MRVEDLMTKNVVTCNSEDSLSRAAELMWRGDCGAVPVLSNEGHLIGMITDRDICMASWSRDTAPSGIPLWSVMSRDLIVCAPSDGVVAAEQLMRSRQIRRLPVVDAEGKLLGILSIADLVCAADGSRSKRSSIVSDEIAATLAGICQPRDRQQRNAVA